MNSPLQFAWEATLFLLFGFRINFKLQVQQTRPLDPPSLPIFVASHQRMLRPFPAGALPSRLVDRDQLPPLHLCFGVSD